MTTVETLIEDLPRDVKTRIKNFRSSYYENFNMCYPYYVCALVDAKYINFDEGLMICKYIEDGGEGE